MLWLKCSRQLLFDIVHFPQKLSIFTHAVASDCIHCTIKAFSWNIESGSAIFVGHLNQRFNF